MNYKNLVFLGQPGAGKGTIAELLSQDEQLAHVSTGDLFRKEMKDGTELALKAKECINKGGLVPDQIVADMVAKRLAESDCDKGFILDGFPRTVPQAGMLEKILNKIDKSLDAVILFNLSEELVMKRLTSRLTCRSCGTSFNVIYSPPKKEGVCDKCNGELYVRSDDSVATVKDRLKVYNEKTAPLVDHYTSSGLLRIVDAEAERDIIYSDLLKALK